MATGVLTLGAIVPAHAGSWSGTVPCPISTQVGAMGTQAATGSMLLTANGISQHWPPYNPGIHTFFHAPYGPGSWSVTGDGATNGVGTCGLP